MTTRIETRQSKSLAASMDNTHQQPSEDDVSVSSSTTTPYQDRDCRNRRNYASNKQQPSLIKKQVTVIGADPSGLVALKELLEAGQDAVCSEQSSQVREVFCRAWQGAQMTSSSLLTAFGCYPLHMYSRETGVDVEPTMWTCQALSRSHSSIPFSRTAPTRHPTPKAIHGTSFIIFCMDCRPSTTAPNGTNDVC